MLRRLAVLVSFAVASVIPATAQTQSHPPHSQGGSHDPAAHMHMPVDPAVHAAMHAQLLGNWSGTLTSTGGSPITLQLAIANDKQGKLTVKMSADRSMKAGAASDVAIDALGLHWMQALSDTSCKATAVLDAATHHAPETVRGTMACEHGELAFALHRTKG